MNRYGALRAGGSLLLSLYPKHLGGASHRGATLRRREFGRSKLSTACRARSKAEFIAKLGLVVEEADQSEFWLGFSAKANAGNPEACRVLLIEAGELLAIFAASQKTAKYRRS
jgi:hypothetical protein